MRLWTTSNTSKFVFDIISSNFDSFVHFYFQQTIKKEVRDLFSNERDIRETFERDHDGAITAEKLTFVLEGIDSMKVIDSHVSFLFLLVFVSFGNI